LINGKIGGAAIDVYEQEPPKDSELLQLPNLIPTPHISGNSYEAVLAMGRNAIKNIEEKLNEFDISVQHIHSKYTRQSAITSDMPI
jgi:phosphoglycerate dehydrogenase-like enzyme